MADDVSADRLPTRLPARLPPQATMGLLDYLTAHALDEDYAFVSEHRRAEPGARPRRRRSVGPVAGLAVALFALLVVVAAAQTSRNAGTDERERQALVSQVDRASKQLAADRRDVRRLLSETSTLQSTQRRTVLRAHALSTRAARLGDLAGTAAVHGPGVRVVVDDAPDATSDRSQVLDTDLQRLANGFWQAGAEAISLNGQRLTTLSTIRVAGGAITVNAHSLSRPYVLQVIGDKDTLPARFAETSSGQAWLDLHREVGLRLSITPVDSLRLPGADVALHYATGPTPGGSR